MTINERIKIELEQRGWTNYKLSKLTNISENAIAAWFKVVPTEPKYDSIKAVAKAFGMKPEDLVSESTSTDPRTKRLTELWNRLSPKEKDSVLSVMDAIIQHNK